MDIMGIGIMELMVIMLVATIVLGPKRAVDMARSAGKMLQEVRQSFKELSANLDETNGQVIPPTWDEREIDSATDRESKEPR